MENKHENANEIARILRHYYLLKHLYLNLRTQYHARTAKRDLTKGIGGPREAAILMRLWFEKEFNFPPSPQGINETDLGIDKSTISTAFRRFRSYRYVARVSDSEEREKRHQITDRGCLAIEAWIDEFYAHHDFGQVLEISDPDPKKIQMAFQWYAEQIKKSIPGSSTPSRFLDNIVEDIKHNNRTHAKKSGK